MNLPGNNEMHLCGSALMEIVEKHINESLRINEPKVRVTNVRVNKEGLCHIFTVTTDPKPEVLK